MAHLFFERLEKRFNTQSLFPFNHFLNLQELERWVGNSLLSQTRNAYQLNPQYPAPYYSAYYGYNQYPSYSQNGSSFFPRLTTWSSWSNQWSPRTYPQSSWTLPMSLGTPSWFSPMYPRGFFIAPTISPSPASTAQLAPVAPTTPSPAMDASPTPSTTTSPLPFTTTSPPSDLTVSPPQDTTISPPSNTNIDPFTGLPGSYPPGTWYGLIKRSNLRV